MWKTFFGGCWKNKVVVISLYICWIDFLRITSGTKGNTLIWSFEPNLETESGIESGILEEKRVTSHLWIRFVARWTAFVVYCSFLVKWQEFMWGNFCGFWVESQCKHVRQRRRFSWGLFNVSGKFESWKTQVERVDNKTAEWISRLRHRCWRWDIKSRGNGINEGLPGVLGNKGYLRITFREQGNCWVIMGNKGTLIS